MPKLRLHNITTIDDANKYLSTYYLPSHNKKFALQRQEDNHRKLPEKAKPDDFAFEITERKVADDRTIKYKTKTYQILRKNYCLAKSTVYVKETFTGQIVLLFKKQELSYKIV